MDPLRINFGIADLFENFISIISEIALNIYKLRITDEIRV